MLVFEGMVPRDLLLPLQRAVEALGIGGGGDGDGESGKKSSGSSSGGALRSVSAAGRPPAAAAARRTGARQLKAALKQAQQTTDSKFWRSQVVNTAGALVQVRARAAAAVYHAWG